MHVWLEQATEASTATQTTPQHLVRADRRKRDRTTLPDLEEAEPELEPRIVAPLTRKALKLHLASIMSSDQPTSVPQTPKQPSTNPPSYYTPTNPSSSSKASHPPSRVRDHMEAQSMFIDKGILSSPEMAYFRNRVMSVADTERPSGRKPGSEVRWQNRLKKVPVHHEATMLDHILPLVIKVGREVKVHASPAEGEASIAGTIYEDFEDCGLDWTVDREFARNYLRNAYYGIGYEKEIALALAKDKALRIQSPIVPTDLPSTTSQPSKINRSAGDLNKAINQACQGGTVAVLIQRLLLEAIGRDVMQEGPDLDTYVYTATIDDNSMTFWVNFANVKVMPSGEKVIKFYMEYVYTYAFRSPDTDLYLQRVCYNIRD
ncbi:MAG: hypothetical protein Q9170_007722 [Blastenia crenularia]